MCKFQTPEMTEDMKSSSTGSVTASNCRSLTMQPGTMHSTATEALQPAASNSQPPPPPETTPVSATPRLNPKDMPNSEFVNRLLAASRITDFYSANLAPHSFFYSEMLRSLVVQSRNEAVDRETQQQQQSALAYNNAMPIQLNHRRNRKRAWPHRYSDLRTGEGGGENNPIPSVENEVKFPKLRKKEELDDKSSILDQKPKPSLALLTEKPPGNIMFPSTPAAPWYPPYPPFFIDLRVSGHIYDNDAKQKSSASPPTGAGLDPKARQGSAFMVPTSSRSSMAPMNLTTHQDSLFNGDKRGLFRDRYGNNSNAAEELSREMEDIKHRGDYSKSRFENDEVIAVVDDADP